MKHKKKIIVGISIIALFLVVAIGVTYSLWSKTFTQSGENRLASDCFHIVFDEIENSGIILENTYPILDEEGTKLKPYEFSITNTCSVPVEYQINFETTNTTTMYDRYVKFMFQENTPVLLTELENTDVTLKNGKSAYMLEKGYLNAEETKNYKVRIWLDESVTQNDENAMNSIFEGKVTIIGSYLTKYVEPILNGTDPVLKEGLIPVTIADNGIVRKAYENEAWYKYADKKWANAVILNDETKVYQSGEIIPEENIESYFVWIPKYRYQLWDLGQYDGLTEIDNSKVHEIPIIFGDYNTIDSVEGECTTPMLSGETGNCKVGDYMTHPAFISMEAKGLWVGKFETGYKGSTNPTAAESNAIASEQVQIKPNVNSWRNIQLSKVFYTSYNYKREFDSHMMKNTEWGAVAYLSHSKYGSSTNIHINNNSNYVTGYSGVVEPTCGYTGTNISCQDNPDSCNQYGVTEDITQSWNTSVGYLASTTGNISGIYDMSGGAWEYVMGVMMDQNDNIMSGRNSKYNSGFNGTFGCPTCDSDTSGLTSLTTGLNFPNDRKYYDVYLYSENSEIYKWRILGDAMGEMGPFVMATYGSQQRQIGSWYNDEAWGPTYKSTWLSRGHAFHGGSGAGVFAFNNANGLAWDNESFRIVLSVE